MSAAHTALVAKRVALTARCAEQRDAIADYGNDIGRGLSPIDRGLGTARSVLPLLAVGGIVALVVSGPGRALRLLRGGLAVALATSDVLSVLRGALRSR
jgi:hypothetical protein